MSLHNVGQINIDNTDNADPARGLRNPMKMSDISFLKKSELNLNDIKI